MTTNLYQKGEKFLTDLIQELLRQGFQPSELERPDHLCFRVSSHTEYTKYKSFLAEFGSLLTEAEVNGRPISTFRLVVPFQALGRRVELLELPAPKEGAPHGTGFEHAEFVISDSFPTFQKLHPYLMFDPYREKILNSELCYKTSVGQAKFHHLSLDKVIEIEQRKITDVVFDFDGTLVRSREKIVEINRRVFSKILGRTVSFQESESRFAASFRGLFENFSLNDPLKQQHAIRLWSEFSGEVRFDLFEGVPSLLESLAKTGVNLHLWTSRDEDSLRQILDYHDLRSAFSTISCAGPVTCKPDPRNFARSKGEPAQFLLIGDTTIDMIAAKNIGAIAGAALWEADTDILLKSGAELMFRSPDEVLKWFLDSHV